MATTSTEGSRRANCPMPRNGEAAKRNRSPKYPLGVWEFTMGDI